MFLASAINDSLYIMHTANYIYLSEMWSKNNSEKDLDNFHNFIEWMKGLRYVKIWCLETLSNIVWLDMFLSQDILSRNIMTSQRLSFTIFTLTTITMLVVRNEQMLLCFKYLRNCQNRDAWLFRLKTLTRRFLSEQLDFPHRNIFFA